ncbi:OLC1v1037989C1 [Oldenlandia corymbosa var. corymbosa]|uniref:OLC1v1037989C1 n=1 Tax=Oldenlandia corymbosa var. corymbosa TaxID=529605 RepID=A0AAV1CYP3_OLDCO|nr:OLC1v1037989C1 [Oldenlandia corymbosa var. corymbosa]
MARIILSNATSLLPCMQSISPSPSSSSSIPLKSLHVQKQNVRTEPITCNSQLNQDCSFLTKRGLCLSLATGFLFSLSGKGSFDANAAILEAEDDEELLEKVKQDRKKRLERQGVINSAVQETAYLQDLVYKLSMVGQAIEKNDLPAASSVLGQSSDTDWVLKVKSAFNKLSSSPEEKSEVETFSTSLDSLISSVTTNDIQASRIAFVASASAFEKWTTLTGLNGKLKGL